MEALAHVRNPRILDVCFDSQLDVLERREDLGFLRWNDVFRVLMQHVRAIFFTNSVCYHHAQRSTKQHPSDVCTR